MKNSNNLTILEQLLLKEDEVKKLVNENANKAFEKAVVAEMKKNLKESVMNEDDENLEVDDSEVGNDIDAAPEFEEISQEVDSTEFEDGEEIAPEIESLGSEDEAFAGDDLSMGDDMGDEGESEVIDLTNADPDTITQTLKAAIEELGPDNVLIRFQMNSSVEMPEDEEFEGDGEEMLEPEDEEFEGEDEEFEGEDEEFEGEDEDEDDDELKESLKRTALKYKKLYEASQKKLKNLYTLGKTVAKENDVLRKDNKVLAEQLGKNEDAMGKATLMIESLGVTNTKLAQIMQLWVENAATKDEKKEMLADFDSAKTINESKIVFNVWTKRLNAKNEKRNPNASVIQNLKEEKTFIKESKGEQPAPATEVYLDSFERYAFYNSAK